MQRCELCVPFRRNQNSVTWDFCSYGMGEGNLFGAHGSLIPKKSKWRMSQRNRCSWAGKNPNHSGCIIPPIASMYRFLWPNKLFHTFSVAIASSECFMLLLFNHNNKNNSDNSSKILEVLEKNKAHYPPQDSNA